MESIVPVLCHSYTGFNSTPAFGGTASVLIDRLVDVTECFNDRMFYIAYRENGFDARRCIAPMPSFMVYDFKTGATAEVLGDDCHIHGVFDNNVIYTTWDPNDFNRMLFSYDLATDVTTLIEANIFEYFDTVDGRVYYTVGNKKHSLLFSNNFDGTDRIELMKGVQKIVASRAGNVFLTRGTKRNTTLFRLAPGGEDIDLVCSDLSSIVSIDDSRIYYINGNGSLCVVGLDGEGERKIADDVDLTSIIIDKDFIYFLRREQVGRDREAYSLYRTDLNGRNIKKLIFNVTEIKNYDSDTIYVYKCSTTEYVATVYENQNIKGDKKVTFKVSKFFTFDKRTETESDLLSLGLPDQESSIEKRGCLKKDLKYTVTYDDGFLEECSILLHCDIKSVETSVASKGLVSHTHAGEEDHITGLEAGKLVVTVFICQCTVCGTADHDCNARKRQSVRINDLTTNGRLSKSRNRSDHEKDCRCQQIS